MKEWFPYGINISEAGEIPLRVERGKLSAICICVCGSSRSPYAAWYFSKFGKPSLYIIGGLEAIVRLSEEAQYNLFDLVTLAPHMVFFLDQDEEDIYHDIIFSIKRKNGSIKRTNSDAKDVFKILFPS